MFPMLPEELDSLTKKQNVKKARKDRMEKQLGSYNISPAHNVESGRPSCESREP